MLPRHFGIGDAPDATVIVDWPDGSRSESVLTAGQTHILRKP